MTAVVIGWVAVFVAVGLLVSLRGSARQRVVLAVVGAAVLSAPLLVPRAMAAAAEIELENLDGEPYPDRLVFSRIHCDPQTIDCDSRLQDPLYTPHDWGVHDRVTLRIKNTGTEPLQIKSITQASLDGRTDDWAIESGGAAGSIPGGQFRDVIVLFKRGYLGEINCRDKCVRFGKLTITSTDADEATKVVELAGFYQSVSEGGGLVEPSVQELLQVFGYKVQIGDNAALFNRGQADATNGDEIIAPYWQRVDANQPVSVRQLAAFHGNPDEYNLGWYDQDALQAVKVFSHEAIHGQSVLPPMAGNTSVPAAGTFAPAGRFGFRVFKIGGSNGEWSDPTRNNQVYDQTTHGCPTNRHCGSHIRVWPVKDRQGNVVPNTYILAQDIANNNKIANYDYQDNIYLVRNVKPAGAVAPSDGREALYRLDVGGISYVDTQGNQWLPDNAFVTPATVPAENRADTNTPSTFNIDGTADDVIYRSYRGQTGKNPMSYALPLKAGVTKVDVRLHFAERFQSQAGKRKFNVTIEDQPVLTNFDIFAAAGGKNKALVKEFPGVTVADGVLDLKFAATVDNTSIAGIEVLCQGPCTPVATPVPTNTTQPVPTGTAVPGTPVPTPTRIPLPPGTKPRAWLPLTAR